MSLIFEALKKLDREKQAPERGFLVVGASGWTGSRRARALPIAAALAAAGVAGFLFAQWAQRPRVETAASATPAPAPNVGRVAPTAPPATYAAPTLAAVVREAAPPPAPSRTAAPAPAAAGPRATLAPVPEALAPAPVEPTFALQAVTEQDGQPVAIVNGQLVRVGDMIEGAQVVRIDAQMVELTKDGRRFVVSF